MKVQALAVPPPPLSRPARTLATALGERLPGLIWRALHPSARQAFLDAPAPPPLTQVACTTPDGWSVTVRVLPMAPGASGEPVVLLATLGVSGDVFRCGRQETLATALVDAGFQVYLVGHRLGGEAAGPATQHPPGLDDVVGQDLPAAMDAVCAHSGYPRVHVVGHGFGGQIALGWAAVTGGSQLASLAVLSAPVRFPRAPSGAGGVALDVASVLPASWRLPTRHLARWQATRVAAGPAGTRTRTALSHTAADVPLGAVHQLVAWMRAGALVDGHGARDFGPALARVREPLWLGAGAGDRWCPAPWALALRDHWRAGSVTVAEFPAHLDHLDVLLHPDARQAVHAPLVAWLTRQRVRAWREIEITDVGALGPGRTAWR